MNTGLRVILCTVQLNFNFHVYICSKHIIFHENPSSGSRVVTCRRTDMTKLIIFFFCNFAKVPKKAVHGYIVVEQPMTPCVWQYSVQLQNMSVYIARHSSLFTALTSCNKSTNVTLPNSKQVPTSRPCKVLNLDISVCFISEILHCASHGRAVLIKTNNSVSSSSREGLNEEGKWTLSWSRANGRKEPFLSVPVVGDEDSFSRMPCTAVWAY